MFNYLTSGLADPGRVLISAGFAPPIGRVGLNFIFSGIVRTGAFVVRAGAVVLSFTIGRADVVALADGPVNPVGFALFDMAGLAPPIGRLATGLVRGFGFSPKVSFGLAIVGLVPGLVPGSNGRRVETAGLTVRSVVAVLGRGLAVKRPVEGGTVWDRAEAGRLCSGFLVGTSVGILFGRAGI